MKKNMKKTLTGAVGNMVPEDMFERIAQRIVPADEERTISMDTITKKKRAPGRWIGLAAALLLVICGTLGGLYYADNLAPDSIVGIDVNPSIELTTNKKDRVLSVSAVNADAGALLDGMDLKNVDLKVAINAIIGSMVKNDYLTNAQDGILITVQNDDDQRAHHIRNLILTDLQDSLKSNHVTASVINQTRTVKGNTAAEEFAAAQNISVGKATFILNLTAKDPTLDAAALAQMSLRDIAAVVNKNKLDIRDIVDYDADDGLWENIADAVEDANDTAAAEQSGTAVTAEEARKIALAAAGVSAENASFIVTELETDDGKTVYEIEFRDGATEYDYTIDAETGKILSSDHEPERDVPAPVDLPAEPKTPAAISPAEAKRLALSHAGISDADAAFIKVELDTENGRTVYEIEFVGGSTEYDYELDAETGALIRVEKDLDDDGEIDERGDFDDHDDDDDDRYDDDHDDDDDDRYDDDHDDDDDDRYDDDHDDDYDDDDDD